MTAAQKRLATPNRAPGPRYLNPLKHFQESKRGGLKYPARLFEQYGPIVEIKTFPQSWFLINSPHAFRHIFIDNAKNYTKGKLFERLKIIGGNGLFFSDGDVWKKNRRIIGPYFKRGNMKHYVNAVVASGRKGVEYVDTKYADQEFDASELTHRIALYVVGRAFFGMEFSEQRLDRLLQAVKDSSRFGQSMLQSVVATPWLPTRVNRQGKQSLKVMYGTIDDLITEGLQREKGADLLSLLLESVKSGEMSRDHLKDEMWTIVNAGHETTATTMALMLYHIGKDPAWQAEVLAEIDEVLEGRDPTFADLSKLQKLDWTTKETLRLFPPAPGTARQAVEDDEIESYHVPQDLLYKPSFTLLIGIRVTGTSRRSSTPGVSPQRKLITDRNTPTYHSEPVVAAALENISLIWRLSSSSLCCYSNIVLIYERISRSSLILRWRCACVMACASVCTREADIFHIIRKQEASNGKKQLSLKR